MNTPKEKPVFYELVETQKDSPALVLYANDFPASCPYAVVRLTPPPDRTPFAPACNSLCPLAEIRKVKMPEDSDKELYEYTVHCGSQSIKRDCVLRPFVEPRIVRP